MKKLIFGVIAIVVLSSCTKEWVEGTEEREIPDQCNFACYISDKYTGDSVFVARDTLWEDECLSFFWWEKTKAVAASSPDLLRHCVSFMRNGKLVERERTFYVLFKNENHPPKIY